jgi:haloalkane dehalogenase
MTNLPVLDSTIHYEESGSGTPLVFLHGNPASSHIWRNILPRVGDGRLLAPDLVGMGASGKPDIPYSFADHARYLDAWFDALELEHVILVGHDWGGGLAFDWASRHPDRVAGIAFLEAIIKTFEWDDLSPGMRARSESVRGPQGEQIVLVENKFLTQAFTGGVLTPVNPEDLDAYLAPYPTPESRRPILAWIRQRPVGGEPAEVVARVSAFGAWLADSPDIPKLLMTFDGDGLLIDQPAIEWCREHVAALEIVACGQAGHHAPEDRPQEIAAAITDWVDRHQLRAPDGRSSASRPDPTRAGQPHREPASQ